MKKFENEKPSIEMLVEGFNAKDDEKIKEAWNLLHNSIAESVKTEFDDVIESNDSAILAQRGHRQLTSTEKKWYQKVIAAMKESDPKQAFITAVKDDMMPTTIIEDVYRDLKAEYPLLGAIQFEYVGYITKWILNDHTKSKAVWGKITDEITKEITSAFDVVDLKQSKLSAFAIIEQGMLERGPEFLDKYIRETLKEAILAGLEDGIVKGTGKDQPAGLIKDIHEGVEFNSLTGYPDKAKTPLTSFAPTTYGAVLAKMAKTEAGNDRKFTSVGFICNQTDYLTKVMPATCTLAGNGVYAKDLFPFPTEVFVSNSLATGEGVLFLPGEYFLGMGGDKNGVIEYSDEYKFIEDQRVFKIKQYGTGRATDNTAALFLDISKIEPAYITVENKTTPVL